MVVADRGFPGFRRAVAVVVAVCLLFSVLVSAPSGAQTAPESQPTAEDVAVRDNLIADQESLLNTYRCLFGVDTNAVPGGCVDGKPSQGPTPPGTFEGAPAQHDIEVRDSLIVNQEALLNAYRCLFGVDTQIVPGGCPDAPAPTATAEPTKEAPPVSVAVGFGSASYSVVEGGSVAVEVVLSAALEQPATIPITASGAGGASSDDYLVPASVTLASGVTSQTFIFFAYSDDVADGGESVVLGFGEFPSGVVEGSVATATVQITDQAITDAVLDSPINIPDANFKAALQKLFRKSATEEITVRDARSITSLNVSNLEISDLTGIEHFINLTSFNVQRNRLSGLVLPSLPKLRELDASNNQIGAVSLESSKLPALEVLLLEANELVELVLDGFPELYLVDLRENDLVTLVLRDLAAISTVHQGNGRAALAVNIYGNPLKSLTVANLAAFSSLPLGGLGTLESVVLSDLPELALLNVSGNRLSGLVLPSLPKLRELDASNNQIGAVSLESSKLPALEVLLLEANELVELVLDGFPELYLVDLRENDLVTLVLRDLAAISTVHQGNGRAALAVNIYGNPLKSLTVANLAAFSSLPLGGLGTLESVVLSDLPELALLNVSGNRLSGLVLPSLPKLRELDASNNQIGAVSLESSKLPALEVLLLEANELVELVLDGFPELYLVDLRENDLVTLVLRDLAAISTVHQGNGRAALAVNIYGNPLKSLTVANLAAFSSLPLGGLGTLESVVLSDLPELALLNVSGNRLSGLVLPSLPKLRELDASNNQIGAVSLESSKLPALEVLLLEANELVELVLDGFPELYLVDLRENDLVTLVLRDLAAISTVHQGNGRAALAVNIYGNPLKSLTVANLAAFSSLPLGGLGTLESVVLSDLPELALLNVSGNRLSGLVLPSLPKLRELDASNNQIGAVSLESSKLPALEVLLLEANELVELVLDGFPELYLVDLRENDLVTLVLRDLAAISTVHQGNGRAALAVNIYGNPLKSLTVANLAAFSSLPLGGLGTLESVVLSDLPELALLNVSGNRLSGLVLPSLPKLRELDASNNQIGAVSLESSKLPALEVLLLEANELVELVLDGFPELYLVDLRENDLVTLVLRDLAAISTVHQGNGRAALAVNIYGNPLKSLTVANLAAFSSLPLGGLGTLESVVLSDLPELALLNVSGNRLSGLVLPSLPKLRELDASNNQIGAVSLESSKLPALEVLLLEANELVELVLDGFPELYLVDLRENDLVTLVLRDLAAISTVHQGNGRAALAVNIYGNPRVKILYDFPEDSSGEPGAVVPVFPVPGRPGNLRVEGAGDGVGGRGSFVANWDAPAKEGDSAIEGYTVTVSHPHIRHLVPAWSDSYEVSGQSFRFDHGDPGYTYTVEVRARNSFGSGPSASDDFAIRCMNGDKYEMRREGGFGGFLEHWRVYALQDFRLVPNGWEIKQGYKGGVVFNEQSLSQAGCAWIYENAAVEGRALVSGNAVLVDNSRVKDFARVSGNAVISNSAQIYDDARVHGNARISGDAKVYDDAEVYGNAQVSNLAEVYGNAEVYGDAKVSGKARIYGYANVYGDVVFSDEMVAYCSSPRDNACDYNGEIEYQREARDLYEKTYQLVHGDLTDCLPKIYTPAEIEGYTREILVGKIQTVSEALGLGCQVKNAIEGAAEILPEGWSIVFELVLAFAGVRELAHLTAYMTAIIFTLEVLKTSLDVDALLGASVNIKEAVIKISEEIDEIAEEECRKNKQCRRPS